MPSGNKKIYCRGCRHLRVVGTDIGDWKWCAAKYQDYDTPFGPRRRYIEIEVANKNNNCNLYEKKKNIFWR